METSRQQLQRIQYAIQKMRSITFENKTAWLDSWVIPPDFCYNRETIETWEAVNEPLLFGDKCILPDIATCLDGEPTIVDVINFMIILDSSHLFKVAELAYGVTPLLEVMGLEPPNMCKVR